MSARAAFRFMSLQFMSLQFMCLQFMCLGLNPADSRCRAGGAGSQSENAVSAFQKILNCVKAPDQIVHPCCKAQPHIPGGAKCVTGYESNVPAVE